MNYTQIAELIPYHYKAGIDDCTECEYMYDVNGNEIWCNYDERKIEESETEPEFIDPNQLKLEL